jgi:hypothetical protein
MKNLSKFFAILLVCVAPYAISQNKAEKPYAMDGTLGAHLESLYGKLVGTCIKGQPIRIKKTCNLFGVCSEQQSIVSAVPFALQNQTIIPMNEKVYWNDQQSLARSFALVYDDTTKFGKIDNRGTDWMLYSQKFEDSAETMLPADTTSGLLLHDCSAVVAGVANADAALELPLAQVKSALTASYNGRAKQSLAVFYGTFDSPFFSMWKDTGARENQVRAMMWLYSWYSRAAYVGNEKLLSTVNRGLASYAIEETSRSTDGSMTIAAGIRAGVVNLQGSASAEGKASSAARMKDFRIAIPFKSDGTLDVSFAELPPPTKLIAKMKLIVPTIDESSVTPAVPGTTVTHKLQVGGIDAAYCTTERATWGVSATDPTLAPTLASTKIVSQADNSQVCEFTLNYLVPGKFGLRSTAADEFTLSYAIRGIFALTEFQKSNLVPEFGTVNVRYAVNRSPEIYVTDSTLEPTIADLALNWKRNLIFREDSAASTGSSGVDWTRTAEVTTASIGCPNSPEVVATATMKVDSGQKTAELMLNLGGDANDVAGWKPGMSTPKQCVARGTIKFATKQAGTYVVREYAVPVRFPAAPKLVVAVSPQL